MESYDWDKPYKSITEMGEYVALQEDIAAKFGPIVRAMELSNREYGYRFERLCDANNMRSPPSSNIHIMSGYLVARKLGTRDQYETWMPDQVFQELYADKKALDGTKVEQRDTSNPRSPSAHGFGGR